MSEVKLADARRVMQANRAWKVIGILERRRVSRSRRGQPARPAAAASFTGPRDVGILRAERDRVDHQGSLIQRSARSRHSTVDQEEAVSASIELERRVPGALLRVAVRVDDKKSSRLELDRRQEKRVL